MTPNLAASVCRTAVPATCDAKLPGDSWNCSKTAANATDGASKLEKPMNQPFGSPDGVSASATEVGSSASVLSGAVTSASSVGAGFAGDAFAAEAFVAGALALDAFAEALVTIAAEAHSQPELLHDAPHNAPVSRLDEVLAAKQLVLCCRPAYLGMPEQV